jgi:hypothetical protein
MVLAEGKARHGARTTMKPISVRLPGSFPRGFCTSCLPDGKTCTFRLSGPRLPASIGALGSGTLRTGWRRLQTPGFSVILPSSAVLGRVGAVRALEKDVAG